MSAGDNYLKWKQRAKQAESELRALKLSHERLRKECMEAETRAERAEADNAALHRALGAVAYRRMDTVGDDAAHAEAVRIHSLPHPGAALLERLRTLEADSAAGLDAFHGHRCGMAGGPHPDNPRECNDAHCRQWAHDLDALKERKP